MQGVIRFWIDRGVDGFRLDAIDRLVKDAELRDDPPASAPFGLPLPEEYARLEHLYSANSPDIRHALAALREAAGDALLVGEVYLPAADVTPYLEHLDAAFAFELFHAPWEADALRAAIAASGERAAWVLSNHDFPRLPDRFGRENVRAAAMLLLTLPGMAFVYQGEEIGQGDGPPGETRRSTAPGATASATRSSGPPTRARRASPTATRGCPRSTRRSATWRTRRATRTRCSRSTAS